VRALTQAARSEHDFAGLLADVTGQAGDSDELTIGSAGSWEAELVGQLVNGTVGYDHEYLPAPRGKLTDVRLARSGRPATEAS
jgi:hypothetical protein